MGWTCRRKCGLTNSMQNLVLEREFKPDEIQNLPVVTPSATDLSHRKPVSDGAFHDICFANATGEGNTLY